MRYKSVIAIPSYGVVDIAWALARAKLAQPMGTIVGELVDISGANIAEKRNDLVRRALELDTETIFFLGDDVIVPPFALLQLLDRVRRGFRVVTGIYWSRTTPPQPYIFREFMRGPYYDWHVNEFFRIDLAGADCLIVDASVFREIPPPWFSLDYDYWEPQAPNDSPPKNGTEDFFFFSLLKQHGISAWCDAGVQCGHVDRQTHLVYSLPTDWPQSHPGSEIPRRSNSLIADIGCGYRLSPVHLEGDVVRYDLNENAKPDVRCDVRKIPEPDNKFDRVYAAHVLEHLPANDSIPAIREWTRILKPGGEIEIMVPNIEAVARKIKNGVITPYLHQMIWGGQMNAREFHLNGFTPVTLRNLIEVSGNLEITKVELRPLPEEEFEIYIKAKKIMPNVTPVLDHAWRRE